MILLTNQTTTGVKSCLTLTLSIHLYDFLGGHFCHLPHHTETDFYSHPEAAGRRSFSSFTCNFKGNLARSNVDAADQSEGVGDTCTHIMTAHLSPPPTTIQRRWKSHCSRLEFKPTVSRGLWGLASAPDVLRFQGSVGVLVHAAVKRTPDDISSQSPTGHRTNTAAPGLYEENIRLKWGKKGRRELF